MAAPHEISDAKGEEESKIWLHAWHDPVAQLRAFSGCVRFADHNGGGDAHLLVADQDRKLKIFQGTGLVDKQTLLQVPVAMCAFYSDAGADATPSVAVASGPYVFIYRNLRPYFKFTLPFLEISSSEMDIWNDVANGKISADDAYDQLGTARDNGTALSSRSRDLLALEDGEERDSYVKEHSRKPLQQMTVVTCMETLNKNSDGEKAVSHLVIGTESQQVLILDSLGATIVVSVTLPGVPVFMAAVGTLDVEYRIVVACRDGNVYAIKNGEVTSSVIELETQPCGLLHTVKATVKVATIDNAIHCFQARSCRKNWSIYLPCAVTCLEGVKLQRARVQSLMLAALENGEVRCYNGKTVLTTIKVQSRVTALRFGTYGRDDNTLCIVEKTGALTFKMLRRTADLDVPDGPPGPPPEQDVRLAVPKKTKLYVEQTQRERDQATEMHRLFQRDLCKLRLATARSYVKIISDGQGPLSFASGASLRLNAELQGLGPAFKIKLNVQNTGTRTMSDIVVVLSGNAELYRIGNPVMNIPLLIPGLLYKYEANVYCLDDAGGADVIRVFLCNRKSCVPVISALVNMPVSEAPFE